MNSLDPNGAKIEIRPNRNHRCKATGWFDAVLIYQSGVPHALTAPFKTEAEAKTMAEKVLANQIRNFNRPIVPR